MVREYNNTRDLWSVYSLPITEHYSLILGTGINADPNPNRTIDFNEVNYVLDNSVEPRRVTLSIIAVPFYYLRTLHTQVTETGIIKPGSHSQLESCRSVCLWHPPPPNQVMMGKNMLFTCMTPQSVLFLEKKIGTPDSSQKKKIVSIAILSFCRLQEDLYSLRLLVTFEDEKTVFRSFWNKVCQGIG